MSEELLTMLAFGLPATALFCGLIIVIAVLFLKSRALEMQHRERLAMIERGLAPPPESSATGVIGGQRLAPAGARSRSLGVVVIGIGFAFMCLIGIAAQSPFEAIGIGGAIVILGAAFIVRSIVSPPAAPVSSPPPPIPPQPPQGPRTSD